MLPLVLTSPRIACRSDHNGKYLRCVHDKSKGGNHIEASAERVPGSARTRFWVEPYDEDKGLVHVRCNYNNKYWKPQEIVGQGGSHWIVGTADEPEELTLFRPEAYQGNSVRFYHPGLRKYACVADKTETYLQLKDEQHVKTGGDDHPDTFTVIGLKYLKDLPEYVAFKGDNGRYLHPKYYLPKFLTQNPDVNERGIQKLPRYIHFGEQDKTRASVLHTVTTNHDGLVRIKCATTGKYWEHKSDFVVAASERNDFDDQNTVFKVHYEDGFTALQNMGNNKFCKRLTSYGDDTSFLTRQYKEDCLSAAAGRIVTEAKLQVEEPVKRKIFDIKFHLDEARIYHGDTENKGTNTYTNIHDVVEDAPFAFTREDHTERKWETTVSTMTREVLNTSFGIEGELGVPHLEGGQVALDYKWSKTTERESTTTTTQGNSVSVTEKRTISQTFKVPPKTVMRAILLATRRCCDVPFSYKQKDVLMANEEFEIPETTHDDGIYTFSNWEYEIKPTEEALK